MSVSVTVNTTPNEHALKKYCEDQASNDLTAEEKQDARAYLENYI